MQHAKCGLKAPTHKRGSINRSINRGELMSISSEGLLRATDTYFICLSVDYLDIKGETNAKIRSRIRHAAKPKTTVVIMPNGSIIKEQNKKTHQLVDWPQFATSICS